MGRKMDMAMYRTILEYLYIVVLAFALVLHVFNMGGEGGLKPFHIAAAIACAFTVVYSNKYVVFVYLGIFLICVTISALISPVDSAFSGLINVIIVTLCSYGAATVDIGRLLKFLLYLIPIDLLSLLYEALQNPVYRFQGFYNDPNYLCTTLLVFCYVCILSYIMFERKRIRIVIIADILIIFFLILLTLSRTGMACFLFLLFASFAGTIRKHFFKVFIVVFLSTLAIQYLASDFVDKEYTLIYERLFESNDNIESAGDLRSELSKQNLRFIADNPSYIFFGLGPGATEGDKAIQIPELPQYKSYFQRDHNTWTSCLSEYGFFASIFFTILIGMTIKRVIKLEQGKIKHVSIAFCITVVALSLSLWQMTYLPFWWGLFLLNNNGLKNIKETDVIQDGSLSCA